jgi:hypothetical protein
MFKITYYDIKGLEEDGTEEYIKSVWYCYSEEEFEYALENIYEGCIISIE